MISIKNNDKYKLMEYSTHSELIPIKGEYNYAFCFFAGFNEHASKYIYLLKNFLEFNNFFDIKVIIPNLPQYDIEQTKVFSNKVHTWYTKYISSLSSLKDIQEASNKETDTLIKNLILKEIQKLGSSKKIIIAAFSQGCFYALMSILASMNIEVCFLALFKSPLKLTFDFSIYKNIISNHIHLYMSRFDKIVNYSLVLEAYQILKVYFPSLFITSDNGKKHELDSDCLIYLKKLFLIYVYGKKLMSKF
jgi:predicted esterase